MFHLLFFEPEAKVVLKAFHWFKESQKAWKFLRKKKMKKMNIFIRNMIFKRILRSWNITWYFIFKFYYRGGLMRGDIIIGINENTINKSKDIYNEVKKGETIIVKVLRNGNIFYLNIEPEIVSRLWKRLI